MNKRLSVLYLTQNEAEFLPASWDSLANLADEIVVVDSGSTDGTLELARGRGARVFERTLGNWGEQRNFGIDQCSHPWVLVMDADEQLDATLQESLRAWKTSDTGARTHWSVRRVHFFMGQRMKFSGLQSDVVERLFHRDLRYVELEVHEKLDAPVSEPLPGLVLHYTYRNAAHWAEKIGHYARRSAADYDGKTGRITAYHRLIKPAFRFVKHYVLRAGFLDGAAGWHYSVWMFRAVAWRYRELTRLRKER